MKTRKESKVKVMDVIKKYRSEDGNSNVLILTELRKPFISEFVSKFAAFEILWWNDEDVQKVSSLMREFYSTQKDLFKRLASGMILHATFSDMLMFGFMYWLATNKKEEASRFIDFDKIKVTSSYDYSHNEIASILGEEVKLENAVFDWSTINDTNGENSESVLIFHYWLNLLNQAPLFFEGLINSYNTLAALKREKDYVLLKKKALDVANDYSACQKELSDANIALNRYKSLEKKLQRVPDKSSIEEWRVKAAKYDSTREKLSELEQLQVEVKELRQSVSCIEELQAENLALTSKVAKLQDDVSYFEPLLEHGEVTESEKAAVYAREEEQDISQYNVILVADDDNGNLCQNKYFDTYSYNKHNKGITKLDKYDYVILVCSNLRHCSYYAVKQYCKQYGIKCLHLSRYPIGEDKKIYQAVKHLILQDKK